MSKLLNGLFFLLRINKQVLKNIVSLSILQGSNYIVPLITFPYLVRVLGSERNGSIAVATAFAQYLSVLVDFGINYRAARAVEHYKQNEEKLHKMISNVYSVKLILLCISFGLLVMAVHLIPAFSTYHQVFMIFFLLVAGNALFPTWFYQGMGKISYIMGINIIVKSFSVIFIFLLVQDRDDYVKAAFIQALGILMSGIVGFLMLPAKFSINIRKIKLMLPFKKLYREIKVSYKVFISTMAGKIYNQGATIVIGIFAGNDYAGYYSVVQKIAGTIVGISHPFAQVIYPYLRHLYANNHQKFEALKKKIAILVFTCAFLISLTSFMSSSLFIKWVTDQKNDYIVHMMRISSIIMMFTICNILFNPFILAMKKHKQIRKVYLVISSLFFLFSIPLAYLYKGTGIMISLACVEIGIFLGSITIVLVKRRYKRLFSFWVRHIFNV